MKGVRIAIFLGVCLVGAGAAFIAVGYKTNSFKGAEVITNEYEIKDAFTSFDLDVDTANIEFVKGEGETPKVTCIEREKHYYEVNVSSDKLLIKSHDTRKWYEKIFNFEWEEEKIQIALPETNFENLKIEASTGNLKMDGFTFADANIKLSTGNIRLSNVEAKTMNVIASTGNIVFDSVYVEDTLKLDASTGNIKFNDVKSKDMNLDASTGNVYLNKVLVDSALTIEASTGDITFKDSDAETIRVKTSTGNIRGNLLTPKTFHTKVSTGSVHVPDTQGGDCTLQTSTGTINIEIK